METNHQLLSLKELNAIPSLNLTENNFLAWKFIAEPLIETFGFMPFYLGQVVRPLDPDEDGITPAERNRRRPAYDLFIRRHNDACLFVTHSCRSDQELIQAMIGVDTKDPQALWNRIQELFNSSSVTNSLNNDKALNECRYEPGGTLTPRQYINQYRMLVQRAVNAGTLIDDKSQKLRFIRQAASKNANLRLSLAMIGDNPAYNTMVKFYQAAENAMNEALDAATIEESNSAAKGAPQANSALLSQDSKRHYSSGSGRGGRGYYNADRGRPYGPRYHARGPWNAEHSGDRSSSSDSYWQDRHRHLTCSRCSGIGHIERNCPSAAGVKRERDADSKSHTDSKRGRGGRRRGGRGRGAEKPKSDKPS